MKGLAFRIGAIAMLMVFVPTIIFSIYEFSTLKQNDEIVESIYNNQLEAILFSLNQYSEDIAESMVSNATKELGDSPSRGDVVNFLNKYPFIQSIISIDSANSQEYLYTFEETSITVPRELRSVLTSGQINIDKLFEYYEANYRKIQPLQIGTSEKILLVFALSGRKQKHLMGVTISATDFAIQVLRPKITQVAEDKFMIDLVDSTNSRIYGTHSEISENSEAYSSSLWLLPSFKFKIQLLGDTIQSLVEKRSKLNLIIIVLLDFTLLLGVFLMFITIRKETKLNTLKSEFISNVSHEIRTPLALIKMYIETLSLGRIKKEDKKEEYYQIIFQETNRLSSIVNKILSFSKIDNGKQKLRLVNTRLNSIVNTMLESYNFRVKDINLNLTHNLAKDLPTIEADEDLLLNVFINLMDNAIKYSGENKEINIATGLNNNQVFFQISDNGFGMKPSEQKHIFDKFYRITEGNLAHKAKGSGLGLSIVKSIVESHKGQIIVESKPGEGSVFTIFLPTLSDETKSS